MTLSHFLVLAGLLFGIGLTGAVVRRSVLVVYMSLEMMLTASMLALVAFSKYCNLMDGAVFCFFIITIAAAEVAVGLALIVSLFRKRKTVDLDDLQSLKN
ncbi:MAG: NADH-quinone oxidoreductase subunit NuoK [Opitutales bacterium]|nr:NADH-quinone oxidoreductase subunit NuoK [Opitutales bacterium]MBQ6705084.1 NADH-quinone oxidoreductase subunit NuoK [Opitutales bacterium]